MIIAIDVETQGLDATKFILGCIKFEDNDRTEFYRSKDLMWKRILCLGEMCANKNKVLNVYGHFHEFDFYAYADLEDPNISIFSNRPFIGAYRMEVSKAISKIKNFELFKKKNKIKRINEKNVYYMKECIKFLCTYAIYRMDLKSLGTMLDLPKLEMPGFLKVENHILKEKEITQIYPYLQRDVEICLKAIIFMKNKLKEEGIPIKRIYTISQIAINSMLLSLKKSDVADFMFFDKNRSIVYKTWNADDVRQAYRGPRTEAFKLGSFNNINYIDINSFYSWAAINMDFPDLRSQKKIWNPLSKGMNIVELFEKKGVSKVFVYNMCDDLGLLPVRTDTGNYFPKAGKYILGTYTHTEIKRAVELGYKVIGIEWSITWNKAIVNPFINILEGLYAKRKESNNPFDNYFYKIRMNAAFGKFAQNKPQQEYFIDSVEMADDYLKRNIEIMKGIETNYLYKRVELYKEDKPYYCVPIPMEINALARVKMHEFLKRIPSNDLVYTDTDSILFEGDHFDKFNISDEMGDFKIVYKNADLKIYACKTYRIGENIVMSGYSKKDISIEVFDKGHIKSKVMNTIKSTKDIGSIGKFKDKEVFLNESLKKSLRIKDIYSKQKLFIDNQVDDIQYFKPFIKAYIRD